MSAAKPQVVILSSIEWDAAWQRHQIFACQFAASGHEVYFVENTGFRAPGLRDLGRVAGRLLDILRGKTAPGLNEVPPGVRIISPRVLPPAGRAARAINAAFLTPALALQLKRLGLRPGALAVAYFPTTTTLDLLDRLRPSLVAYDCASNFRAHPQAPGDILELERRLLSRSALVVTDSDFLYAQKKAEHDAVVQIHQGVAPEYFRAAPPRAEHRRFCYYGSWVADLDPAYLEALADAGFEVTISGFLRAPPPARPDISVLGPVARERLVERLESFDVFLLPHRVTEFMRGVVPAKIYECLAMGRPVLAAPLPSLSPFKDLIHIAGTPEEWVSIARDLPRTETAALRARRMALAREHTHEREFARLLEALAQARRAQQPPPPAGPPEARLLDYLRAFGWIGFFYGLARLLTLGAQVLAGRLLGPIEYGKANLVVAAAAVIQVVPMLGFPVALAKFPAEDIDPAERSRLIGTSLTAFSLWALAWLGIGLALRAPLARAAGLRPEIVEYAILLAFATAAYTVLASPLLGLKRFRARGAVETVYGFCAPATLAFLFASGHHSFAALIAALVTGLAAASAFALWAMRAHLKPALDAGAFRRVGGYTALATLNLVAAACVVAPGRLLLGRHFTAREVGVFSAYFTASAQISLALTTIAASVLVPLASRPAGQQDAWRRFRRWGAPIGAASLLVFFVAQAAGLAIFGRSYPFRPAWALAFSASAALILLHGAASSLHAARDIRGLRVSVTGGVLAGAGNVALALVLVPRHGIAGSAVALLLAYAAGLAYYLW